MKHAIIVLLAIGLGCLASNAWAGEKEIGTRKFVVDYTTIVKFLDPDNGNVCYLVEGSNYYKGAAISCLKQ